ncbi:MAG: bifunctional DNA-formamidopyrimidine glycosylase/DNA-(apurinic or apyrimidinic site) lyase [Methylicorpusculum sp.]|uniref:bifunctional DNA-formamidopyrimidine glycosylase/DNA-(apurinic or apyrimidinic site) lyase n=2 Tax=Methylicorpusculum sp. TaxID=2713644 RepID=UPI00272495DD|nr:bifunctional DNA-formamidopyrimidine glycosylase/DNA-(apurinic or apyrimidinic site) lyase [Methylicorpusculum sp.]MDO8938347.1 bifunctional DNA-formamidopyrimidine glycosylase/DNA-(apurinic or apyrimidinic site) lyase [Methylicorpusculum sp.]
MPELPEVETTRRGIQSHLEGNVIQSVCVRESRFRWPVTDDLQQILPGLTITHIARRGKYLLLNTVSGTLIIHLGMSGSLRIVTNGIPPQKHDHIDFIFAGNLLLRFNDPRRFGAVLWTEKPVNEHPLLKDLGPEPLESEFNGEHLYHQSKNKSLAAKSFIMDSHTVVGVGNIYANEALFMAGIKPTRSAGKISLARYRHLADCIRRVLQNAISQGGTTLRDFVNEDGKPGYFKQQLKVYGRGGEPCTLCLRPLTEIRISNRTTVFCPHCQT